MEGIAVKTLSDDAVATGVVAVAVLGVDDGREVLHGGGSGGEEGAEGVH